MYRIPYLYDPGWANHHFGEGVDPDELRTSSYSENPHTNRPWSRRTPFNPHDRPEKKSHVGKDGFQVCLDVQHFKPSEITVSTVNNVVVVEATHEERPDEHGYITRNFKRRYDLPKDFEPADVVSTLSSDGILTIKVPHAHGTHPEGNVRHIHIQHTGPAALNVKPHKEGEIADKK